MGSGSVQELDQLWHAAELTGRCAELATLPLERRQLRPQGAQGLAAHVALIDSAQVELTGNGEQYWENVIDDTVVYAVQRGGGGKYLSSLTWGPGRRSRVDLIVSAATLIMTLNMFSAAT